MVGKLSNVSQELYYLLYEEEAFPLGPQSDLLETIRSCIDKAIPYQYTEVIDKAFLNRKFPDEIATAKGYFETIKKMGEEGAFRESIAINMSDDTIDWLLDAFGVNIE